MKFSRARRVEPPEINLIAFIDVLLVVLIFLMLSTTYSRSTQLQINLPTADTERAQAQPQEIVVAVSSDGQYAVDDRLVDGKGVQPIAALLRQAAQQREHAIVVIHADAFASHQSVMTVMEAAKLAGVSQLTFAAQSH